MPAHVPDSVQDRAIGISIFAFVFLGVVTSMVVGLGKSELIFAGRNQRIGAQTALFLAKFAPAFEEVPTCCTNHTLVVQLLTRNVSRLSVHGRMSSTDSD